MPFTARRQSDTCPLASFSFRHFPFRHRQSAALYENNISTN